MPLCPAWVFYSGMTCKPIFYLPAMALALATPTASPAGPKTSGGAMTYYGVNIGSAGFAPERLPGVHGQDYIYPDRAVAAPFVEMRMTTARLPFLWERLQPELFGPLDPAEAARLDKAIADLDGFSTIILDLHNYARYRGQRLDQMPQGGAALADLWDKLARRVKANPRVAYGIMNEPHDVGGLAWRPIAQASINAIRRTGATQLILVPGVNWTGGAAWFDGNADSSASTMGAITDPANNYVFEIHQYFDYDSSGTSYTCVDAAIGEQRLAAVTRWMRDRGKRAVLGEFGASSDPTCLAALDRTLTFLNQNSDVWKGWTYWAAGAWWGDYPFSIQPQNGVMKPQASVLKQHVDRYRAGARVAKLSGRRGG